MPPRAEQEQGTPSGEAFTGLHPPAPTPPGPIGAEAPTTDQEEDDGPNWALLPVLVYTPETEFLLGAAGLYFFPLTEEPDLRASQVRAAAVISTRGQWVAEARAELWFAENRHYATSKVQYSDWPDSYFGIGNRTSVDDEEGFRLVELEVEHEMHRLLSDHLYLGVVQRFWNIRVEDTVAGGLLSSSAVAGVEGGNVSGLGISLTYDSRDSTTYSMNGAFYRADLMLYHRLFFSDYEYVRLCVDLRRFFTLFDEHVLALQLLGEFSTGRQPFTYMPMLGGRDQMRGYYDGRFRANHMTALQAEYRLPLFWRLKLATFGGIGQVFERIQDFDPTEYHWSAGAGLRFEASSKHRAHIRVDAGFTRDSWGIYFTALEAF